MGHYIDPPLAAKDGRCLKVLFICRISTVQQDARSLEDQEGLYHRWVTDHWGRPYDAKVLASQGSGESLEREDYLQALELVSTGRFDLVLSEDLARICRRVHAHLFCEECEDHQTRLIAINDMVDTGRGDWRLNSFFAVMRHEAYNRDTALRIRRSHRNRFVNGGMVQFVIFGYRKRPGAKSDDDLEKIEEAGLIIDRMVSMLEGGARYSEVADWLNAEGIRPGPHARSSRWTGVLVRNFIYNPILKGWRVRNVRMAVRINKTGCRKSVRAPHSELLVRKVSRLAFIEECRYDRLIRMLDERNGRYRRGPRCGVDCRAGVPRKRSVWPGQHLTCGVCGRIYYYGGHGQADHLECSGARKYCCWNGVSVDGPLARRKLVAAIFRAIEDFPGFDAALSSELRARLDVYGKERADQIRQLQSRIETIVSQKGRLVDAIKQGAASKTLTDEILALEAQEARLQDQLDDVLRQSTRVPELPTAEVIRRLARDAFKDLAESSQEFARLMKLLIPKIVVSPYRLCDGGLVVLRASFALKLVNLLPKEQRHPVLDEPMTLQLVVDLFDPPQREAYRERVMSLRRGGKHQRQIAGLLGLTQPAVQDAIALAKTMEQLALMDPYIPVLHPPDDQKKMRRHRHPRYRFEPLDGFGQTG